MAPPTNTELIENGEHTFAFPPTHGTIPSTLGKCQGPCRMIVTRKEAINRKFGPCNGATKS